MVNKLSIAALVTAMITFAVPAVMAKEFRNFEDFLQYERDLQRGDKERTTMAKSELWRAYGTFWNPFYAKGFKPGLALAGGNHTGTADDNKGCAVVVYYDALDYRNGQKNDAGGKKDFNTWIKPLGVAPVCANKFGAEPKQYPGPGEGKERGRNSMLFSNYNKEAIYDTYLVLNQLDEGSNKDKDCIKMEDFKGQQIQWGGKANDIKRIWGDSFGEADLKDWFSTYVQDTRSGCILNPYKVGRGDKLWSDFNWLGSFWGYDEKGLWKDVKGDNKNIKKRSRAAGIL